MLIKQTKKVAVLLMSWTLLFCSMPISVFAQANSKDISQVGQKLIQNELWTQEELGSMVELYKSKPNDNVMVDGLPLLGPEDSYAKYARVQATKAKGGEAIETVLANGTKETKNVAKAGDWIVTNPGGEKYIVPADKFAKKYEAALDLGEGWFKPTGGIQKFRKINYDMRIIASWGEEQVLKKGAYVNVTTVGDMYGVGAEEFKDTYKSVKTLYQENLKGIRSLLARIESKLKVRFPKYNGVFFKRFLSNDVDFMAKKLAASAEKKAARNAARTGSKKVIAKNALRTFGGAFVGIGMYMGFTLWSAPEVQAANTKGHTKGEIINKQVKEINNASTKSMVEKMIMFTDQNKMPLIIRNAKLLEEMGLYKPTLQACGLSEEDAAEIIANELAFAYEEENAKGQVEQIKIQKNQNPYELKGVQTGYNFFNK